MDDTSGPADVPLPRLVDTGQHSQRAAVRRQVLIGVGLVVALGVGTGIGAAASGNSGVPASQYTKVKQQLASTQAQLTTAQGTITSQQGTITRQQNLVAQDEASAQNAQAAADAKAKAKYASMMAQAQSALASANQQEKTVAAEMGQLQASQISGDGVYVVGKDIKSGVYHTNGSGNTGQNDCYFATLNSTDTSNIADNNNFDGPETVDVSSAYAFQISGPCTWVRVS